MKSTTVKLSYDNLNYNHYYDYYSSSCDLYKIFKLSLLLILNISAVHSLYEEYRKPTYLEGRVGSHIVFNCHIDFPQEDVPIPYVLHWKKDVSIAIIIIFNLI